jgi:predicted CXXCH cytochrome family protein
MQSACFRKSEGRMTCTTCHDPHARTSTDVVAYEAICLTCHQGASRTPCSVSPATGCIDCHMPCRDASRGMMMTDHWIRSRPEADARGSN